MKTALAHQLQLQLSAVQSEYNLQSAFAQQLQLDLQTAQSDVQNIVAQSVVLSNTLSEKSDKVARLEKELAEAKDKIRELTGPPRFRNCAGIRLHHNQAFESVST